MADTLTLTPAPETLAALQARYPRALETIYDALAISRGEGVRPGEMATSIFDFASDGLRLLVSRDRHSLPVGGFPAGIYLHVSASFPVGCDLARKTEEQIVRLGPALAREWFLDLATARFRILSGDSRPLTFLGWSEKLIPHWYGDDPGLPKDGR